MKTTGILYKYPHPDTPVESALKSSQNSLQAVVMALRALVKADTRKIDKSSVAQLYRSIIKELPRVMTIYDIDMPFLQAKSAITWHFRKNASLKDGRVIGLLLAKGYMEVEETLMQWKQKTHLLRILEPMELQENKFQLESLTPRQKVILGLEV